MKDGDIVKLECLGSQPGSRWLEGSPDNSKVRLVANATTGKTSCLWRVHSDVLGQVGVVLLESLSTAVGDHWLDGLTLENSVKLSTHSDKPYTGIRWQSHPDPQRNSSVFTFECLGDKPGNRWLDGLTKDGKVQLAPSTADPYTGTRWKVYTVVAPQ